MPMRGTENNDARAAGVSDESHRLMEPPSVELVYAVGSQDRVAQTCWALIERRIPSAVEKPLGTSLEQLRQVRRATDAAHVPVTEPLIERGVPADRWLLKAAGGGCPADPGPHFAGLILLRNAAITVGLAAKLSMTMHTSTVGNHAILVLTTPDGREAIVEVGCAAPQSELKRHRSYSSAGEAGLASTKQKDRPRSPPSTATLSEPPPTWTAILCMTGVWGRSRARSAIVSVDCRPRASWRMSCGSSGGPTRLTEKGLHDG